MTSIVITLLPWAAIGVYAVVTDLLDALRHRKRADRVIRDSPYGRRTTPPT